MYYYRLYGMRVCADLDFAQLVPENEPELALEEIRIEAGELESKLTALSEASGRAYVFGEQYSWLINRTLWMEVTEGRKITYHAKEGANPIYLRTYLLGFGMAMLGLQRGILAMHCSAVANEKGAILIAGESGAGKSTMTTAFLSKGYRLMADDMAFVEKTENELVAKPAFPFQKLCRDAALAEGYRLEELIYIDETKDKFMVPYRGEFLTDEVPVRGMLLLGKKAEGELSAQHLEGLDKFHVCANNLFLRNLLGKDKYAPVIGQKCLEMAAGLPICYLSRPVQGNTADQTAQEAFRAIEEWK
ncbi:MAG: hypothetical protein IJY09_09915 [Lachnospiraceae bacterium]|nr:hypothetical protein [Lachnospiraceae bacterium]